MGVLNKIKREMKRTFALSRAINFVWGSSPRWTIISVILLIVQGLLPILSLYMMKLIVDEVSNALINPSDDAFEGVLQIVLLAGSVALITNIFNSIYGFVSKQQGRVVEDYMQDVLQSKAIKVDLEFYENAEYQDTLHRAQREASYRPIRIVDGLMRIAKSAISLIGVAWLLVAVHWSLGAVLFIAVLPGIFVRLRFSNKMYHVQRDFTNKERQSWYYAWMLISIEFAKEVRMFNLGRVFKREFQGLRKTIRNIMFRVDLKNALFEIAGNLISITAVFGSYAFIAYQTVQGNFTLGDLVMYYQAFQRGQGFLRELLGGMASLYENNLFLSNLYEFLDLENKIPEPVDPQLAPNPMRKGIKFENIWFRYPQGTHDVIKGVSLDIKPGEVVALVGENGSGKTTLIKLLCRLYTPTEGKIKIDNIEIDQFPTAMLRQHISVIFQDYVQYNLTARENIWLGNIDTDKYDSGIEAAAEHAGVSGKIMSLPNSYETILGKRFAKGEELSIGQWQKVALARAFFRDSQIIVLDEPTSAMDPKAEYEVFMKFKELLEGRTAILISHRLSTVRMADRIYVLNEGRVLEQGTHDDLVKCNGVYAHLFQRQAKNYQ